MYAVFFFFSFTIVLCCCPSESLSLISRLLGLPLDLSASEGLRKHDKTADHRVGGRENKTPQLSIRAVPMAQPALPEAVRPALFPQQGDAGSPPSTHEGNRNRRKITDEEKKRSCEVRPPADPYGRSSGGADKRRLVRPVFRDESGSRPFFQAGMGCRRRVWPANRDLSRAREQEAHQQEAQKRSCVEAPGPCSAGRPPPPPPKSSLPVGTWHRSLFVSRGFALKNWAQYLRSANCLGR